MIFIFPGTLFRKFYFRGDFTNQFNQGNLLERFIWTLLFSILSLVLCFFSIEFIRNVFGFEFLDSISYDTIKKIFDSLSSNKLPNREDFGKNSQDFLYVILAIYFLSAALGFVLYNIIRLLNIDKKFSVFTFSNYWHYLAKASDSNGFFKSKSKYFTYADILVDNGSNEELYSGTLYEYHIDNNNKLECVVLTQAYKFTKVAKEDATDILHSIANNEGEYELYKETVNNYVFKKHIKGNLLTFFYDKILNINLTYVRQINPRGRLFSFKRMIYFSLNVLYYLTIIFIFFIPWLNLNHFELTSIPKKITFVLFAYMILTSWIGYINQLLGVRKKSKNTFLGTFSTTLLLSIPNLWAFNISTGWSTISYFFGFFTIIVIYLAVFDKNNNGNLPSN